MPDATPDLGTIRFQRARDLGDIVNATFAFLRDNAREVFIGYLAIVGPVYVAVAVLQTLYFERLQGLGNDPERILEQLGEMAVPIIGIMVAGFAAGLIAQATASAYVVLYRQGEAGTITPSVLWDEARGWIGPMAGITGLMFVGFVGLGLLFLIPCLGWLGGFALLIWAYPVVFLLAPARVLDEDSAVDAWTRARLLVEGSWGFAFGTMFVTMVILIVFSLVLSIPSILIGAATGLHSVEPGVPQGPSLGVSLALLPLQVVSSLIYLLPIVAAFFLHGRLAEDLDGSSLHSDLDTLAGDLYLGTPADARSTPPASAPPSLDALDAPLGPPDEGDRGPGDTDAGPDDTPGGGFRGGGFRT